MEALEGTASLISQVSGSQDKALREGGGSVMI